MCLFGCSEKRASKQADKQLPFKATGIMPGKDSVAQPKVVMLNTCPPPQVVTLPNSNSVPLITNPFATGKDAPLESIRPAVFSVNMTTYGAEQGLYSLINTMKKDRHGCFWFGTGGGGVIRYDGKTATSYTTAQGLASNNIRAIAEDKNGNFWFGTQGGGASFYDGRYFTKITKAQGLSSNNIRGIVIDSIGNVWFATYGGGISVYNGRSFTHLGLQNGLPSNYVNCILQAPDGTIWCGTDSGVCRCMPAASPEDAKFVMTYTTVNGLASNHILSMAADRTGNVWFGTQGGGVSYLNPDAHADSAHLINSYTMAQGLPDNRVKGVFADTKGRIWLCTPGGGVCSFDPVLLAAANPTALTQVRSLLTIYNAETGLSTNKIECAAEDEDGNLWFGTDGGGVDRFDGESLKINIAPNVATKSTISCVNADKAGNIWMSTGDGGICCYDGKNFRTYCIPGIMKDNALMGMLEDKSGRLWFATSNKGMCMSERHSARFTLYTTMNGMPGNRVSCLTEDTMGCIWIGTDVGITSFDGKSFTTYNTAQGLGSNLVWCTMRDRSGNMWFGTFGGGLSMFVPHPADGGPARFLTYTTAQGLASNSVKCITQDKCGNIWIGTGGGGVSRWDGNSFTNYTTLSGLANNVVVAAAEDKNGRFWFGTNEGFGMLKGFRKASDANSATLLPADNKLTNDDIAANYLPVFEKYNFKNGFPIKDLNNNAMYIDTSGVIWAGTADRLIKFDYNKLNKNADVPHVFINAIQIAGEKICWHGLKNRQQSNTTESAPAKGDKAAYADSLAMINEEISALGDLSAPAKRDSMYLKFSGVQFDSITSFYPLPVHLVLPYKNNNITFDFTAIELARPYLVRYQYMLEGYDKDWSPVTERSNASFGNIHEGAYTFKLRAQRPGGEWSEPVTYHFDVLPPFYRTWWAYVLYCIGFVIFISLIVRFRISILKKENAHLEQVVSERTAQIEQEKAAVLMQANDLKKLNLFKDKIFSILSHDLRGPISTSATVVAMLDDDDISIEEFKDLKEGVVKQLNATSTLVDNLLKWAKGSMEGSVQQQPQQVNIYDVMHKNATLFEESLKAKKISFNNNIPKNITAYCDPEHIDIVIRNLLANAIKFTEKNGSIQVTAKTEDGYMNLAVTDTGVGMTTEQLDKLFKPLTGNTTFGTAGETGTGLGLLLSYEFMKANKGHIAVASEVNKGTTFTVILPTA